MNTDVKTNTAHARTCERKTHETISAHSNSSEVNLIFQDMRICYVYIFGEPFYKNHIYIFFKLLFSA